MRMKENKIVHVFSLFENSEKIMRKNRENP